MYTKNLRLIILLSLLILAGPTIIYAQSSDNHWPKRILITNDNGIEDPKLIALASGFAPIAETFVVTSIGDRSGSTHYISATKTGNLVAEQRNMGNNIRSWAIDGYPADAVLLALTGIMKDSLPDLVISGINECPNLAHDWIGSGTIGAARMAAYAGVPAIAVSGVNDESLGAAELKAAVQWVIKLARSELAQNLEYGQYLTVSFPGILPTQIKGVKVAPRAGLLMDIDFNKVSESGVQQTWKISVDEKFDQAQKGTDAALHHQGYIVVVLIRANEHDYELLKRLQNDRNLLPQFDFSGKK